MRLRSLWEAIGETSPRAGRLIPLDLVTPLPIFTVNWGWASGRRWIREEMKQRAIRASGY